MLLHQDTSKQAASLARREGRYAARHTLWDESALPRVKSCGRAPQAGAERVGVKVTVGALGERHAGYAGLQHCGSVWACPVCSATISARRQSDIERALTAWHAGACGQDFGRVALVTLTMRHNKHQSLARLWDALGESWHLVASGDGWTNDQAISGVMMPGTVVKSGPRAGTVRKGKQRIPIIRVVEVTHGINGWHVHIHALLLLPPSATDQSVAELGASMFGRWSAALKARGLSAARKVRQSDGTFRDVGVDARLLKGDPAAALGEYFTKAVYSGSMEVARSDMKTARLGGRTPFGILAAVVKNGDADDLDLWHEWERASKGRRQTAWTMGLRALLLPEAEAVEMTDEEIVDVDVDGDLVADIAGDLWRLIVARRADHKLLRAFERSNRNGWRLLWLYAKAADHESAARWAGLLAAPDPLRRSYQTKDVG